MMIRSCRCFGWFQTYLILTLFCSFTQAADSWLQLKGDSQRSGNAPAISIQTPLSLAAAVPLTDGIYTSPVVSQGTVFVVDGAGVVFALNGQTGKVLWKYTTKGGTGNCNNVASPAIIDNYLHVGTAAGYYYVFDLKTGAVIKELDCREPIFSAPVVNKAASISLPWARRFMQSNRPVKSSGPGTLSKKSSTLRAIAGAAQTG